MPIADPSNCSDFRDKRKQCCIAIYGCDGDLRFRAAISGRKTPSFCRISGDLAPSTRKSLAIAIVRFRCAKNRRKPQGVRHLRFRDAEMTIKMLFERSSQKGGSAGGSKRGSTGDRS